MDFSVTFFGPQVLSRRSIVIARWSVWEYVKTSNWIRYEIFRTICNNNTIATIVHSNQFYPVVHPLVSLNYNNEVLRNQPCMLVCPSFLVYLCDCWIRMFYFFAQSSWTSVQQKQKCKKSCFQKRRSVIWRALFMLLPIFPEPNIKTFKIKNFLWRISQILT